MRCVREGAEGNGNVLKDRFRGYVDGEVGKKGERGGVG